MHVDPLAALLAMHSHSRASVLTCIPLFTNGICPSPSSFLQMPHMHVDPLAALLKKYITTINLKRGQVLFRQGDAMAGLYIVESGEGVGEEVHHHHQPQEGSGSGPVQAG